MSHQSSPLPTLIISSSARISIDTLNEHPQHHQHPVNTRPLLRLRIQASHRDTCHSPRYLAFEGEGQSLNAEGHAGEVVFSGVELFDFGLRAIPVAYHEEIKQQLHHENPKAVGIGFFQCWVVLRQLREDFGRGVGHRVARPEALHVREKFDDGWEVCGFGLGGGVAGCGFYLFVDVRRCHPLQKLSGDKRLPEIRNLRYEIPPQQKIINLHIQMPHSNILQKPQRRCTLTQNREQRILRHHRPTALQVAVNAPVRVEIAEDGLWEGI
jgi:hypothetical protein